MEGGNVNQPDQLMESMIFPSKVYTIEKPEFLDVV